MRRIKNPLSVISVCIILSVLSCSSNEEWVQAQIDSRKSIIYSDVNLGEIVRINDSIIVVYNNVGIGKSESKIINLKSFK